MSTDIIEEPAAREPAAGSDAFCGAAASTSVPA